MINIYRKRPRILFITVAFALFAAALAFTVYGGSGQELREPVLLTVFVYDDCGGCGVGDLGCGTCDIFDELNMLMRDKFGDRLNDGSITYRLFNTRIQTNEENRRIRVERYGVPPEHQNTLPVAFIGTAYEGIFLAGDENMLFVKEKLDRYLAGESITDIQESINILMNP